MSNQFAAEESLINRISRFIRENGLANLPPQLPLAAGSQSQAADLKPSLTHNAASSEKVHPSFSINESPAQMTIFYSGQVIVLNLPSTKAEAILRIASKASSFVPPASSAPANPDAAVMHLDSTGRPSTHTPCNGASGVQANRRPNVADLPMERKASLKLFFEKRKNRINARAPYNVKGEESSKSADGKPWLALAAPHNNSEI